ncbi:hypothetical protein [Streptomyces sp. NPDC002088]|uniref:hypothetical protein n=1 Tax=Streptomyces sp. NPDC002088 TaxID=3154665 RepID=UPI00332CCF47
MVEAEGDAGGEHPEGGDGRQAGEVGAQRSGDRKGEGAPAGGGEEPRDRHRERRPAVGEPPRHGGERDGVTRGGREQREGVCFRAEGGVQGTPSPPGAGA